MRAMRFSNIQARAHFSSSPAPAATVGGVTRVVLEYVYTMPAKVRARAANPLIADAAQA